MRVDWVRTGNGWEREQQGIWNKDNPKVCQSNFIYSNSSENTNIIKKQADAVHRNEKAKKTVIKKKKVCPPRPSS